MHLILNFFVDVKRKALTVHFEIPDLGRQMSVASHRGPITHSKSLSRELLCAKCVVESPWVERLEPVG